MHAPTKSQLEALATPELMLSAGGQGVTLPCPLRMENLRLLTFLDGCARRSEASLSLLATLVGTSDVDATKAMHHAVVLSAKQVSTRMLSDEVLRAEKTNAAFYDEAPDALWGAEQEGRECGSESGEDCAETPTDDADVLCRYLAALLPTASLHRVHFPIVDGRPPSVELLCGLFTQLALRAKLLATLPALQPAHVTIFFVDASTTVTPHRTSAICGAVVAQAVAHFSSTCAGGRCPVRLVASAACAPLSTTGDLLLVRRFDSVSMAPLAIRPSATVPGNGASCEVVVFVTASCFDPRCSSSSSSSSTVALRAAAAVLVAVQTLADCRSDDPVGAKYFAGLMSTQGDGFALCSSAANFAPPVAAIGALRNSPLAVELAFALVRWHDKVESGAVSGSPALPHVALPVGLLRDDPELRAASEARLLACVPLLRDFVARLVGPDFDAAVAAAEVLLRGIGTHGVAVLLRCRITVGSVTAIDKGIAPPPVAALLRAFVVAHEPGQALSVGARALAKHIHRDESASWWGGGGQLKGTQAVKNERALAIVHRILDAAEWCNVHMLPHDIVTIEYRVLEGYGARWTAAQETDDEEACIEFRGFLEPVDPEGHVKGWRH